MQGWESVCMFRGALDSLTLKTLIGFVVSKFLGFTVFWFLGSLVAKCLGFKVSRIPYYQKFISCFLEGIDPVSKIFNSFRRIFGICRCPPFRKLSNFGSSKVLRYRKITFCKHALGIFLICLGVLVSPKIRIVGFGGSGHVQKFP